MEARGINLIVDKYSIGCSMPNLKRYDIIFAGGGADIEQSILAKDLIKYRENIKEALDEGVFFLFICGAYQLFGKHYKDACGNIIPGLKYLITIQRHFQADRKKQVHTEILLLKTRIGKEETEVIGFETTEDKHLM